MDPLKQFKIAFVGLSNGKHTFSFEIDNAFFSCFETSEIAQGHVTVDLVMDKKSDMLVLDFVFGGEVELSCDRCLELYQQPIDDKKRLFIKFGDQYEEQTEDIVIIPATESHMDISQFIYEFIHLGLPLRHVHADMPDGKEGCDPGIIEQLNAYMKGNNFSRDEVRDDPRWDALKKLKLN